jgi:predicted component of type VI protein secretion system
MNTHELIESTMLHALGLLEDAEREAYEAAFAAAPTPVQIRVREEARRMADLGDLVPEAEPTSELRSMVLAAVRAAMREEENEARIANANTNPSPVIGRIDANSAPARATSQPKLSSSPRVNRVWRVAAIGFAAASIALGVITINMQQTFEQAQSRALVANLYDTIGAKYLESTIFDANTQRVALTSQTNTQQANTSAVAAVWTNPDWDTARLFVKNLVSESDQPYRLVVLDKDGNIFREIATFSPSGEFQDFDVDVNLTTERNLAIYPAMVEDIQSASPLLISSDGTL